MEAVRLEPGATDALVAHIDVALELPIVRSVA